MLWPHCFLSLRNRASTKYIDKYNLLTNSLVTQITLNGYSPGQVTYQWGGYSGVDLAVDEQGLWVLWGNSGDNKRLYASKIDNDVIVQTHSLSNGENKWCMKWIHNVAVRQRILMFHWRRFVRWSFSLANDCLFVPVKFRLFLQYNRMKNKRKHSSSI